VASTKAAGAAHRHGVGARDFEHAGEPLDFLATKVSCEVQSIWRRVIGPRYILAGRRQRSIPVFSIIAGGGPGGRS
jgi:hypothetical protein